MQNYWDNTPFVNLPMLYIASHTGTQHVCMFAGNEPGEQQIVVSTPAVVTRGHITLRQAIDRGIPVVSWLWVRHCATSRTRLNTADYLLISVSVMFVFMRNSWLAIKCGTFLRIVGFLVK